MTPAPNGFAYVVHGQDVVITAISLRVEALSVLQRPVVLLTASRTTGGKINDSTATDLVGSDARAWRQSSREDVGGGFLDHIRGIDSDEHSPLRQRLDGMAY